MDDVTLNLNEEGHGGFYIREGGEQMGEMIVSISGNNLTVYHTEVSTKAEGKGFAKKLLTAMIGYVRSKGLKVIPLCPYVHAQFRRYPVEYNDVWNKEQNKNANNEQD